MPYNTQELKKQAIKEIEENNLFFVEDVCDMLGISKQTFYSHFKVGSNEFDELKALLQQKKAKKRIELRKHLHNSKAVPAMLALYKLVCSDVERRKISMEYKDTTTDGEKITDININVKKNDA